MYVLITCKFKKYQMNGTKKQALMHAPITWKYQKDWIENNQEKVETPFSASLDYGRIFSSPVQSTGRAIVVTLAFALALPLPFPSRHF